MQLEETQDKEDILILFMIQERDKQINLLEAENFNLKRLLIEMTTENKQLKKLVKRLRRNKWAKKN